MPQAPRAPLTNAQITLIAQWINEGANNKTNCGTPCDSNNFTYSANIKPMMDTYCKGCHSGVSASKGIVLDTYDGVKKRSTEWQVIANHQARGRCKRYAKRRCKIEHMSDSTSAEMGCCRGT